MFEEWSFYEDYGFEGGQPKFRLRISQLLYKKKRLFFLDHCARQNILVCSDLNSPTVMFFDLQNHAVEAHDLSGVIKGKIRNGFLCRSGVVILQTSGSSRIFLLKRGEHAQVDACVGHGSKPWHGSWSIDESTTGCLMYAEYTTTGDPEVAPLHVYRSVDGGYTWRSSLKVPSSPVYGKGEIRHFHVCQADPFIRGRWYVSSGDKLTDNKLYVSDDDGVNWRLSEVAHIRPLGYAPPRHRNDIVRFTSLIIDQGGLYWPTDDNIGGNRALLCRAKKDNLFSGPLEVDIDGFLSRNLARNIIKSPFGYLIATEAKDDPVAADVFLRTDKELVRFPSVKNLSKRPSGFTISKSSKAFARNEAFGLTDVHFLNQGVPALVRFKLEPFSEPTNVPATIYRPPPRGKSKLVFFHAQRTAGSFLKSLLIEEYGRDKCLFYQTSSEYCAWGDLTPRVFDRYRVYAGHENYSHNSVMRAGEDNILLMSIVRHPVERAISLYYYLKTRPEHKLHALAQNADIVRFYREAYDLAPDYVSNTQTLRVSGQGSFHAAKPILDENFYMVAPFDRLSEVINFLKRDLKWSKIQDVPYNTREYDVELRTNAEFLDVMDEINYSDFELYRYAKLQFESLLQLRKLAG